MHTMYLCICALILLARVDDVIGHGGMTEPPMRSVLWKESSEAPVNYDWNALYCGGFPKFKQSGGKCGLCGDAFDGPFENDKGGIYDKGIIVRHYPVGLREIEVKVEITAHHKGYMQFKLCPNNDNPLTKACLDRHPLQIREGRRQGDPYKYEPPTSPKLLELHVVLPPDVICDRCVLQWTYTAGNSHGTDARTGRSCVGCGLQETFVNCADISIGGTIDRIPVATNVTEPTREVVIPTRNDIVDIIQNASPDTSITEVLRQMDITWNQPASNVPRNQPPTRRPRPQTRQTVRPRRIRPPVPTSPPREGRNLPNNRRQRGRLAAIRRQINENSRRWSVQSQSRNPAQPDRAAPTPKRKSSSRRNPSSSRRAPARRNPSSSRRAPARRNPRPSGNMIDRRGSSSVRSQRPAASNSASLLDTMNRAIDDIRRNGKPRRNPAPRKPTRRITETGVNIFGDPIEDNQFSELRERVPEGSQWRRSDGRSSHRDAVRHARQFGGINIPLHAIRKHVPELPLDILPRRDVDLMERRRASAHRDNWFPESRRASPARSSRRRSRLPRRIVVQSMMVAQHLLRKFPQLRGRVYLSREANRRNILAHMTQKYRLRQRWH